jgi:hypothetical protein
MIFPSREIVKSRSSCRSLCALIAVDATRALVMRTCGVCALTRVNCTKVSLLMNILSPQTIYIPGRQLSPHAGLVYDRRLGRVSSASFEVVRFRSDSLRLEWS